MHHFPRKVIAPKIFLSYLCHITSFLILQSFSKRESLGGTAGSKPGLLFQVKVCRPFLYHNLNAIVFPIY